MEFTAVAILLPIIVWIINAIASGYTYDTFQRFVTGARLDKRIAFSLAVALVPRDQRERFKHEQSDEQLDEQWDRLTEGDRAAAIELLDTSWLVRSAANERIISTRSRLGRAGSFLFEPRTAAEFLLEQEVIVHRSRFHWAASASRKARHITLTAIVLLLTSRSGDLAARLRISERVSDWSESSAPIVRDELESNYAKLTSEVRLLGERVESLVGQAQYDTATDSTIDLWQTFPTIVLVCFITIATMRVASAGLRLASRMTTALIRLGRRDSGEFYIFSAILGIGTTEFDLAPVFVWSVFVICWAFISARSGWRLSKYQEIVLSNSRIILVESLGKVDVDSIILRSIIGVDLRQGTLERVLGYGTIRLTVQGQMDDFEPMPMVNENRFRELAGVRNPRSFLRETVALMTTAQRSIIPPGDFTTAESAGWRSDQKSVSDLRSLAATFDSWIASAVDDIEQGLISPYATVFWRTAGRLDAAYSANDNDEIVKALTWARESTRPFLSKSDIQLTSEPLNCERLARVRHLARDAYQSCGNELEAVQMRDDDMEEEKKLILQLDQVTPLSTTITRLSNRDD